MEPMLANTRAYPLVVTEIAALHSQKGRIHSIRDVAGQALEPILEWGTSVFSLE